MNFEKTESGLIMPSRALFHGHYLGKIIRACGDVEEFEFDNLIVNQGLNHILGVEFSGVSQVTAWYLAPFSNNYVPIATDTAASIVANAGETIAYTATTRVPYTNVESAQQVSNAASPASFTFTGAATLYGAFLTSSSAISSTTGVLFSAAQFASPKTVALNDQLLLTYVVGSASA